MIATENTPETTQVVFFTTEANAIGEGQVVSGNGDKVTEMVFSNSVLNTLNRWIPDRQTGNFWPLEAFEPIVNSWNGCPIVYCRPGEHLNPLAPDFNAELKRIGGRIVGFVQNSRISKEGHPRLMAALPVHDAEVIALWKNGKLGISTAFTAFRNKDRRIVGGVTPHHVLLFQEDEYNQQRDKSAIVCSEGTPMFEKFEAAYNELKAALQGKSMQTVAVTSAVSTTTTQSTDHSHTIDQMGQHTHSLDYNTAGIYPYTNGSSYTQVPVAVPVVAPAVPAPVVNVPETNTESDNMAETEKIQELNKEIEAKVELIASLNKEVEALKADAATKVAEINAAKEQLEAKDKIIAGYIKADKDAKYAAFKNTIKKAYHDTPEKDAALRNRFENDLPNLVMEMNKMLVSAPNTEETGAEAVAEQNAEAKEVHGAGEYDPITKQWK
jgi:hypothetical protein